MKPADHRALAWEEIRAEIHGRRLIAYEALLAHGPCTTRQLARRAGLDILAVRPRVTELYQLGLVVCDEGQPSQGREGVYTALPMEEAAKRFLDRQPVRQTEMAL